MFLTKKVSAADKLASIVDTFTRAHDELAAHESACLKECEVLQDQLTELQCQKQEMYHIATKASHIRANLARLLSSN